MENAVGFILMQTFKANSSLFVQKIKIKYSASERIAVSNPSVGLFPRV